jgi:hypothetical protein
MIGGILMWKPIKTGYKNCITICKVLTEPKDIKCLAQTTLSEIDFSNKVFS